jgi:hypothetical protein
VVGRATALSVPCLECLAAACTPALLPATTSSPPRFSKPADGGLSRARVHEVIRDPPKVKLRPGPVQTLGKAWQGRRMLRKEGGRESLSTLPQASHAMHRAQRRSAGRIRPTEAGGSDRFLKACASRL